MLDGKSGRSRGFAFINFENIEDATEARNAMVDAEIDGKKIRVDFSITKRQVLIYLKPKKKILVFVRLYPLKKFNKVLPRQATHPNPRPLHGHAVVRVPGERRRRRRR